MDRETVVKTALAEGAKATPPVAVVATHAANGWTMGHTAAALTILYLALQIGYLAWKWNAERQDRAARLAQEEGAA